MKLKYRQWYENVNLNKLYSKLFDVIFKEL